MRMKSVLENWAEHRKDMEATLYWKQEGYERRMKKDF
jgi:hypothetical protein